MSISEADAKTKWCPFSRVPFGNGTVSGNRGFDGHPSGEETLCVGADCMAWRWIGPELETADKFKMGERPDGEGWECTLPDAGRDKFENNSRWSRPYPHRDGFCGMAGKP